MGRGLFYPLIGYHIWFSSDLIIFKWTLKVVCCFTHFAFQSFPACFAEHHGCDHLEMSVKCSWEPGVQVELQFSPIGYGSFYKTALSRNGQRERCKYASHKRVHCSPSLWFPILTCGHTLRNLWVMASRENWKPCCLNDKIRNNVKEGLIFFKCRDKCKFSVLMSILGP